MHIRTTSGKSSDVKTTSEISIDELQEALTSEQFRLEYQPKVSLGANRLVGVEALLRWDHPQHGPLAAQEFIALAERSGVIVPIGEWVLHEAFRQLSEWRFRFANKHLKLGINISTRQLHAGLAASIRSIAATYAVDAKSVALEITETTAVEALRSQTATTLNELKALGFSIAIDDFGTGYSTLEHLHQLPIDEVKIDSSFISGLGVDRRSTANVASIINLAHAMQLAVVAEGVESVDQLHAIRALGCDFAQGYFIGAPMPATQVTQLLGADSKRCSISVAPGVDDVESLLLDIVEMTQAASEGALPEAEHLTTRQVEILRRLLAGDRVPRIARDLYVSQSTVRNHLSTVYRLFGVHSQDELLHLLRVRRDSR